LYIPHDGDQVLGLQNTAADRVSDLTPLPLSPLDLPEDSGYITPMEYDVPVPRTGEDSVSLTVPYRSTLKKLQARWVGDATSLGGIDGQAELVGSFPYLAGTLTNHLGRDLADVYLAFGLEGVSGQPVRRLVYLPRWPDGTSVDLWAMLTDRQNRAVFVGRESSAVQSPPGMNRRIDDALFYAGDFKRGWAGYWYGKLAGNTGLVQLPMADGNDSMPILSLFDLLPPMSADAGHGRVDLLRRGARLMDASAAVNAGRLLIVARDANPNGSLSFPMTIQTLFGHAPIAAGGTTYYQVILPLQRAGTQR
jgi:hypothetical protein